MKQYRKEKGVIEKMLHIRVDENIHSEISLIADNDDVSLNWIYNEIFKNFVAVNAEKIQQIKQQTGVKKWI